ncbi:MAG: transcriptional regulator NrdR [Kiritimatiellaceae bacterium]|jgi:transcriptional repressor NrdR|nr:transcriptional regulator NrdR [Kiritimatiellaceae bacterium]|tara:strand:- start:81 stop:536 length:456 start_codon:yes stop_codon:yes gene_type:complete
MKCIKCEERDNRVIDSREVRDGNAIRRRRVCNSCGHRFTTYEEVQRAHLQVTKRDGRREEFSRDKLMKSLAIACRKRHISVEQLERITDTITSQAESDYEREIPSIVLGRKVMEALVKLDEVAYIRYASVYRRFRDAGQFMNEVERLIGRE